MNLFNKYLEIVKKIKDYDDIYEYEISLPQKDLIFYNNVAIISKIINKDYNYYLNIDLKFIEDQELILTNLKEEVSNYNNKDINFQNKINITNFLLLKINKIKIYKKKNKLNKTSKDEYFFKKYIAIDYYILKSNKQNNNNNNNKENNGLINKEEPYEKNYEDLLTIEKDDFEEKERIMQEISETVKLITDFSKLVEIQGQATDIILEKTQETLNNVFKTNKELKIADKYNKEYASYWSILFIALGIILLIFDFVY